MFSHEMVSRSAGQAVTTRQYKLEIIIVIKVGTQSRRAGCPYNISLIITHNEFLSIEIRVISVIRACTP